MSLSYSVITICLNAADTIERTMLSVLRQNPLPERHLFVDGGSRDGTLDVVRKTVSGNPEAASRCRILIQAPQPHAAGIPAAWNQALRDVRSDLVFILNADDWYEPHAAATVLGAFADGSSPDIVVSPIQYRCNEASRVQRVQHPRSLRLLPFLMPLPHPGCFIRRLVYDRIGLYDERYAVSADYDFIYRASRAGCAFRYVSDALVTMQPGGFARKRLAVARRETRDIAMRNGAFPALPWLAYLARRIVRR